MSDLKDFIIKDGVLTKYIGKDTDVVIPDKVTKIDRAFFDNKKVVSIKMPKTVKSVRSYAFSGCKSLTSITLSEKINHIDEGTFEGCKNLKSITFSSPILSFFSCFDEKLFKDCKKLDEIIIEAPEDKMVECFKAVYNCKELRKILIISTLKNSDIASLKSEIVKIIKSNKKTVWETAIKYDDVELIEKYFYLYKAINIDELDKYIENSNEAISIRTFLLKYKENHFLAERIESIEREKAEKEFGIRELTLSDWKKIYTFDKKENEIIIKSYKGNDCEVAIPSDIKGVPITAIGYEAFSAAAANKNRKESLNSITSVILPDTIKSIAAKAFMGCKSLEKIEIPKGIEFIGERAFTACSKLADKNGFIIVNDVLYDYIGTEEKVVIPAGVTTISARAFEHCEHIKSVIIPEGIEKIGNSAFSGCIKLTTISILNTVNTIGFFAFSGCKKLKSITIGSSVTSIGDLAFANCDKLIINGVKGSYAEQYAKKNKIKFVAE